MNNRNVLLIALMLTSARAGALDTCLDREPTTLARTLEFSTGTKGTTQNSDWIQIFDPAISVSLTFSRATDGSDPKFELIRGLEQWGFSPTCGRWSAGDKGNVAFYGSVTLPPKYGNGEAILCITAKDSKGEKLLDCSTRLDLRRAGATSRGAHLHPYSWSPLSQKSATGNPRQIADPFFWAGPEGNLAVVITGKFRSEAKLAEELDLRRKIGHFKSKKQPFDERLWTLRDILLKSDFDGGGSVATWTVSGPAPLISAYVDGLSRDNDEHKLFYDFGTQIVPVKVSTD